MVVKHWHLPGWVFHQGHILISLMTPKVAGRGFLGEADQDWGTPWQAQGELSSGTLMGESGRFRPARQGLPV